jgi:cell division protein FtsB
MVRTWVASGSKSSDRIDELEKEIDFLERKREELKAELQSLNETILEKQNRLREMLDEQAKQDSLG